MATRMLARMCRMRSFKLRNAVAAPAIAPAAAPAAVTAPPSGNEPSTVRSGKSNSRKVRKAPSATRAKMRPVSIAPTRAKTDNSHLSAKATAAARRTAAAVSRSEYLSRALQHLGRYRHAHFFRGFFVDIELQRFRPACHIDHVEIAGL